MDLPKAVPGLLAHVQRGRLLSLTPESTRVEHRVQRPRPVLDEAVFDVPVDLIVADSPVQTREPFDPDTSDEDAALVEVVRQGLWTPPVVLRATDPQTIGQATTYQIEDGHRRIAAHRLAGCSTVRALITRHDGREADLATLRANTFKRLPPVQQARAIARIHERHSLEYKTVAEFAGLTPRYVSDLMRLLDAGEGVVQAVEEGRLTVREAARLGRTVKRRSETIREPAASPLAPPRPKSTDEQRSATIGSADPAIMHDVPRATLSPNLSQPSPLQSDLTALGWLTPDQVIRLVEWTHAHPLRLKQTLAIALLLSTHRHLTLEEVSDLEKVFLQQRVGQGIVQILEIGLRIKRAVETGQTSREERDLIHTAASWLLSIPDMMNPNLDSPTS